jgi:hypothetical protein
MAISILIFVVAGLAEIGGGYLVWLWLRESKSYWYGIAGSILLVFYGIIPTLQSFPLFRQGIRGLRRSFCRACRPLGLARRPQGAGSIRLDRGRGMHRGRLDYVMGASRMNQQALQAGLNSAARLVSL